MDEGKGIGDHVGCDLECCKLKCEANAKCNSFAASARNCYLKDKCVFPDSPAKKSAYKTHYRECPAAGIIENTCGSWENDVLADNSDDSDGFDSADQALEKFITCLLYTSPSLRDRG